MSFLHAIVGAAWIYFAFAGLCTLAVKLGLRRRLQSIERPQSFDTPGVFAALVMATAFPLLWLLSAAFHIGNSELTRACCQWLLESGAGGRETLFWGGAIALVGYQCHALVERWRARHGSHGAGHSETARRRVAEIVEDDAVLASFGDRIRVVACADQICAVRGFFRPTIEIAAGLVEQLDDEALRAALLHEAAHLRHRDPIRSFAGECARICNPFSRLLSDEFRAWQYAREIGCDRAAVDAGARPIHLADAILTSTRASAGGASTGCQLCGKQGSALESRIQLLLATDDTPDHRCPDQGLQSFGWAAIVALLVPHLLGAQLWQLHCVIEKLLW